MSDRHPTAAGPPPISLERLLAQATAHIWPKRKAQEALFDLPERKRWTAGDQGAAVRGCAHWLMVNGVCPAPMIHPTPVEPIEIATIRHTLGQRLCTPTAGDAPGVAADLQRLAPLVGAAPKTLANSLSDFPRSRREDHRWLLALGRLITTPPPLGMRYEDRSQAAMIGLLARMAGHLAIEQLDAVDAVTLFSLIALWQRRRPPAQIRGNRGRRSTRRAAPKPMARLCETLIGHRQIRVLLTIESTSIRALAFEAALTQAHLYPHADRSGGQPIPDRILADLLPHADPMYRHRIGIMRAWQTRQPWPDPPSILANHPYVIITRALAQRAWSTGPQPVDLLEYDNRDWPGKAMLAPALRHRLQGGQNAQSQRVFRSVDQPDSRAT